MSDNTLVTMALAFAFGSNNSKIQLLPANDFKAKDGRPKDVARWRINSTIAAKIINKLHTQKDKLLIDYEHQTLNTEKNGNKSPAAGWFKRLEWIEGSGLFAVDVEWTKKAKEYINNREYRYVSPVLSYNKQTGDVTGILMAALVNNPAIDGMQDVSELIAAKYMHAKKSELTEEEMQVCALMGIAQKDYIATKNITPHDHSAISLKVPLRITENEFAICEKLGVNINDYLATKENSQVNQ